MKVLLDLTSLDTPARDRGHGRYVQAVLEMARRSGVGAALVRLFSDDALAADLALRGKKRAPQFSRAVQATAIARAYRRFLET